MGGTHRIRLTERDSMEAGVRCPNCGSYTSFSDIIATGHCRGIRRRSDPCETALAIDLVVRQVDVDVQQVDVPEMELPHSEFERLEPED